MQLKIEEFDIESGQVFDTEGELVEVLTFEETVPGPMVAVTRYHIVVLTKVEVARIEDDASWPVTKRATPTTGWRRQPSNEWLMKAGDEG